MCRLLSATVMVLLSAACSVLPAGVGARLVYVTERDYYDIAEPAAYPGRLDALQIVSFETDDTAMELLVHIRLDQSAMYLGGMLPGGEILFTVHFDGHRVEVTGSDEVFGALPPAYLLADIQFVYWPLVAINARLHSRDNGESCMMVAESDAARQLICGDETVLEIRHLDPDGIELHNRLRGYRIRINQIEDFSS